MPLSISRLNRLSPKWGMFDAYPPDGGFPADGLRRWCFDGANASQQMPTMKLITSISSVAIIYASILIGSPQASAQTSRCTTNVLGNTYCYGSSGSRMRMSEDMFGNKVIRGTSLNGSSWKQRCTTNMFGKTTCL